MTPRLVAVARYARQGRRIADIGTDHAYLPIWLVGSGISSTAIASDLRKGPLERADKNIAEYGLSERIKTTIADGLLGIEEYCPEDIFICGMGGELIVKIIDAAPFGRSENIRMILQPMTHAEILREYLADGGFRIVDEDIVTEKGEKIYQIIVAEYSGEKYELSALELMLGPGNLKNGGKPLSQLAKKSAMALRTRINGLSAAGVDTKELCALEKELLAVVEKKERGDKNEI